MTDPVEPEASGRSYLVHRELRKLYLLLGVIEIALGGFISYQQFSGPADSLEFLYLSLMGIFLILMGLYFVVVAFSWRVVVSPDAIDVYLPPVRHRFLRKDIAGCRLSRVQTTRLWAVTLEPAQQGGRKLKVPPVMLPDDSFRAWFLSLPTADADMVNKFTSQ